MTTNLYDIDQAKPPRKRRKDARPSELLNAALEAFARHGFHATSMEEIGAQAGVSKGTVYLYFDSKEKLFMEAIQSVMGPLLDKGELAVMEWDEDVSSLLRQLAFSWNKLVKTNRVREVLKLMLTEGSLFPALAQLGGTLTGRVHAIVKDLLERGIGNGEFRSCDTAMTASIILAPLGFREVWRYSHEPFGSGEASDDAYFSVYIDLVLQGLMTR